MMYLIYSSNVIEVMESSSEAVEDENDLSNGDESEFPASLQFAFTKIAVIFNDKSFTTLDRSNFDFNESYEDFIMNLDMILVAKAKQPLEVIQAADKKIRWKWYTIAKSQSKTQSIFNALESETHYRQMQSDIRDISDKNPILRNIIMRICVDITIVSGDVGSSLQVSIGRMVIHLLLWKLMIVWNKSSTSSISKDWRYGLGYQMGPSLSTLELHWAQNRDAVLETRGAIIQWENLYPIKFWSSEDVDHSMAWQDRNPVHIIVNLWVLAIEDF